MRVDIPSRAAEGAADGDADVPTCTLLMGIELVADPSTARPPARALRWSEHVVETAFAKGLIVVSGAGGINGVEGDYVCLAPPYTISRGQIDDMIAILSESLEELSGER